jgi:hypothetical protein
MTQDFESLLAAALRSRPEPVAGIDLAAEAIRRGRAAEARAQHLMRLSRWTQLASLAAVVLVAATLVAGYLLWPASTSSTTDSTADGVTADSASSSSTYSYTPDPALVGGAVFLGAVAVLAVGSLLTADRSAGTLLQPV